MTHGHELHKWGGDSWRELGIPGRKGQRGKIWDKYNNIINKIYFKNKIKDKLIIWLHLREWGKIKVYIKIKFVPY